MEFTYQLAFLCQVEQAEGNNARKAPLSNPSPPSLPWQILSFFLGLPQKAIKAKAQENSQENACLPINEICANVQESARNLARGQKAWRGSPSPQKVAYKSNVLREKHMRKNL